MIKKILLLMLLKRYFLKYLTVKLNRCVLPGYFCIIFIFIINDNDLFSSLSQLPRNALHGDGPGQTDEATEALGGQNSVLGLSDA